MDLSKVARVNATDRERINRIAQSAAAAFRDAIARRLGPLPRSKSAIYAQVAEQVANDFAQHLTTSLSGLMAEFFYLNGTRTEEQRWSYFPRPHLGDREIRFKNDALAKALRHRSSPVSGAMATLFGQDKELAFRLFFEPTRHSKTTMSIDSFKQDADGLRMHLEQQWLERKERKEAGTETEFGPRTRSKPRPRRYKVAVGSVTTNGLVVRGVMFDTSQRKPGKAAKAAQGSSPLKGVPLLGGKRMIAPDMTEHLVKHRTTLQVVGIDPGMAFPCAAAILSPDPDSSEVKNILISKASLSQYTTGFSRRLEARKARPIEIEEQPGVVHPSMKEIETLIPVRGLPGFEVVQQYAQWYANHELLIKALYRSNWYKRLQWHHAKLNRAAYDKVFDAIVHSASPDLETRTAHRDVLQVDADSGFCTNLLIVIGNGAFGPNSRHQTLMKHIVKNVGCTTRKPSLLRTVIEPHN
ncbi:hypothetical protein EC968_004746 [Mortierella alpina]|nr:hypothetical protein EC968_004746 [Mortierella alpina]